MRRVWNIIKQVILIVSMLIAFLLGIACSVILIVGVDYLVNMLPEWWR